MGLGACGASSQQTPASYGLAQNADPLAHPPQKHTHTHTHTFVPHPPKLAEFRS
jgi:hypothetical protein